MNTLSLRTRLFLYSIIFCFTGVVIVGVYSYRSARRALVQRTYQQLTSLREEKKARIQTFFFNSTRDIELIARDKETVRFLKEKTSSGKNPNPALNLSFLNESILSYLSRSSVYNALFLFQPNGQIHWVKFDGQSNITGGYSARNSLPFVQMNQKVIRKVEPSVVDFTKSLLSDELFIYVACSVIDSDSSVIGIVALEISENSINRITSELIENNGQGKTGEVYLVGPDFLMRSTSRFLDKSVLSVSCKSELVERAVRGETGTGRSYDYRNSKVLGSFSPLVIYNLEWVILAEMDWDEALMQISKLGKRILLICLIVFLSLTVGVFLLSKKITAPLNTLINAASKVGEGDFDQILPIPNSNEIGQLTEVFNKMTVQLKYTTNRLKEREQRLSHFYKATVDGILLHKSGSLILVNSALSNLTGFSEDELMKKSPEELMIFSDDVLLSYQSASSVAFEAKLRNKSGQKIPVEIQKNRIYFHGQEVEALVIRDISRRKEIEEELHSERQRQMRSVIDGQEQERQRLSRELHDGLGQTLVAIKLKLESIPLDEVGNQRKTIEMVKQIFNQTIEETRRMSNNLMPAALTEFSLAVVLRNLCTEVESNSGINVSLVLGVLPDTLSQLLKTYIYRIVQEALNNIVKHSGATRAVVSIFSDISKLYLHVEDNGIGFDPSKGYESGNGLYNMRERAILLDGKFGIVTSRGKGVKIQIELPIYRS